MANQSIRNIINTQITKIIPEIKKRVKEEGKKKIAELKQELLTPEKIIAILQPEINEETCSASGKLKFSEKADELENQIIQIEEQILKGIGTLQDLEDKISSIANPASLLDTIDIPKPNIISKINGITDLLRPLTDSLNLVIKAAPAILAASSGPVANGTIIAGTNNNVNKAKSLVKEFINLFRTIPKQLKHYQRMADDILKNIRFLKDTLQQILSQINLLKSFIIFIEMDFLEKCGELSDPNPPEDLTTGETIPPQMTLEDIIKEIENLYGNVLNSLVAQGDQKAIERTFVLNNKFERIKNIKVRVTKI